MEPRKMCVRRAEWSVGSRLRPIGDCLAATLRPGNIHSATGGIRCPSPSLTGTGPGDRTSSSARLIRHARYFTLQLAESYLTGSFFRQILQRIERLAWHPT